MAKKAEAIEQMEEMTPETAAAQAFLAAYSDGPDEIQFHGRRWVKGIPQQVTAGEWAGMQARGDVVGFGFGFAEIDLSQE